MHGKLIGGGVALALTAGYCVSTYEVVFNFGNISRGMNPLFMLSRALPLVAGKSETMDMYLENPTVGAHAA